MVVPAEGVGSQMIEAVTVSVGYADFLQVTLPYMLSAFDSVLVVTSPDDRETAHLCDRLDVRYVKSIYHTQHHQTRTPFDKARLINHGLAHLGCDDWLVHIDADIVVPRAMKHWLQEYKLDPSCIYGVDRYDCKGEQKWQKLLQSGWLDHSRKHGYLIQPPPHCTPCARVGHGDFGGYSVIGFWQLWHASQSIRYPTKPTAGAERTDLLHSTIWPRESRVLIPDWYAIHLSTGDGKAGRNWFGRTTPRFGRAKEVGSGKRY